jgi:hypothetical protein
MDSFPFTFNLIYEDKKENISPPLNFLTLKEKISELFSISETYLYYKNKEIKNETDYFDLINEITDSKFLDVDINIYLEQQEIINEENEIKEGQENNNILEMGVDNKYDSFGDTRNRKGNQDEKYTNQNKGFYEQKRINYIKEKKEMQREMQRKKNKEQLIEKFEEVEENRKRKLKEFGKKKKH